jgi:hypothetical protein
MWQPNVFLSYFRIFGMVLYEGKRVVGIIVTTLKIHRYDAM